ncbi:hypothetical protein [Methylomagnum ishizawai]|uniref:hypothetical protein n=1 Tax=Methylomagnum ishizawai TaxID=1760988 RepID=UPI001C80F3B3|nr:hypothetical protein [Methylomagnum ishizawai]
MAKLPAYGADPAMAMQFHVTHSATVRGAGIIAGPPYDCAGNDSRRVVTNCARPDTDHPPPDAEHLESVTWNLAKAGAIDDPGNLRDSRVWLFSGKADTTIHRPVMDAVARYYRYFLDGDRIVYKTDLAAGHALITEGHGNP